MKGLPQDQAHKSWGQDRAIYEGKEKLRKMRKQEGEDGEAVKEYCLLVSSLLNEAYDR